VLFAATFKGLRTARSRVGNELARLMTDIGFAFLVGVTDLVCQTQEGGLTGV
jgi:hypothetical protein